MPGATEQQRKQMDAAEAQVRQHLAKALVAVREIEEKWFPANEEEQVAGAIRDNVHVFNLWAGAWKGWALTGRNAETGDDYPVSFWLRIGADLADAFATATKGTYDASLFAVVANTTRQTAADAAGGAAKVATGAVQLSVGALQGTLEGVLPQLPVPTLNWKGKAALTALGLGAVGLGGAYVWRAFK